jgi:outer membrane murein-binding lipoprotein Lpp
MDKGFETLNNRIDNLETRMDRMETDNQRDHKQIILAFQDLNSEVKCLDTEVVQIKRVK